MKQTTTTPIANNHVRRNIALALIFLSLAACGERNGPTGDAPIDATNPTPAATLPPNADSVPVPPAAEQRPHEVTAPHGAARRDEYYWLRDDERADPAMLAYLEAENDYADAVMAPLADSKAALYEEIVGRIKQDDSSVPYKYKDYWYYTRFEEGQEYPIHARREGSMDAPEEIMLDVNELAEGHDFYQVGNWKVSPDQTLLAYVEDTVGRRQFTLRVKDLGGGETLSVQIPGASTSLAWAADNRTLYYVLNDEDTLLTRWVKTHTLGGETGSDPVVYEELDDSFYMGLSTTRSEKYICIGLESTVSSELRCTEAAAPGEFRVLAPRERDFEYTADHHDSRWVIRTNWNAENFKLMEVGDGVWGDRSEWRDLIGHDADVFIGGFELFDDFMAVGERSGGLTRIRIVKRDGQSHYVEADETAYTMALSVNAEPDTDQLRYTYTSLTTPASTYELNVRTGERTLLKEQPVLGDFDKNDYVTERLWATARDGARIPVSVLYRSRLRTGRHRRAPAIRLRFLRFQQRPAVQQQRPEPGRPRHGLRAGAHSRRTGNGPVLVRRRQVAQQGQHVHRLYRRDGLPGRSGLRSARSRGGYGRQRRRIARRGRGQHGAGKIPRVIVSLVPFVDVVTTMLDASIPLTTNEYDEWGNPEDRDYYDYILLYSPYDQLEAKDYPAMFVSTGLWDSQVQYWEPSKYVARLRARKTDDNLVVYRVQMEAGHGGQSGRFQRYLETAERYAFLVNQLGVETLIDSR